MSGGARPRAVCPLGGRPWARGLAPLGPCTAVTCPPSCCMACAGIVKSAGYARGLDRRRSGAAGIRRFGKGAVGAGIVMLIFMLPDSPSPSRLGLSALAGLHPALFPASVSHSLVFPLSL